MSVFKFKEFEVNQDHCAMKIGTDGVLLGAWAGLKHNPESILDIGTGTGVVALMLAQRSDAMTVDALELDDDAYEQATENFEQSSWGDRLFCYHAHLYEFAAEMDEEYDLIVCNPPYFSEDTKSPSLARNQARFEDSMPFDLLVGAVDKLLSAFGTFCVVLPRKREEEFISLCSMVDLHPNRILRVKGNPKSQPKRSLIEFSYGETQPKIEKLTIEIERHEYTNAYKDLVKDFYLKM